MLEESSRSGCINGAGLPPDPEGGLSGGPPAHGATGSIRLGGVSVPSLRIVSSTCLLYFHELCLLDSGRGQHKVQ